MQQTLRVLMALVVVTLSVALVADELSASSAALIGEGERQMQAQDIEGAIATLTRAVEADPASSLAHTRLGGAYLLNGQYDPAIAAFREAISADSANADAFVGMAVAYMHTKRLTLAKAALNEAKRIEPGDSARIDEVVQWIDQNAEKTSGANHR
jgi:Tfp pilus assembly protein PilF